MESTNSNGAARNLTGFTLIELLLAIGIMSIILAAMSSVLWIAIRMNNGVTDTVEDGLPAERALMGIQRDLANLICSTNSMGSTNGYSTGFLIGPFQTINQTNTLPDQIPGSPDFYTTGGQPDGLVPWGDIEKVNYLLSAPANRLAQGKDLVRAVTRNLLPVNPPLTPDQKQVILSGVQTVSFTFYDGLQWDQQWDSTQQTNLPCAIKMDIRMVPQPNTRGPGLQYELVIPIDVQVTTNSTTPLP
jgi:type II secretion system protein J